MKPFKNEQFGVVYKRVLEDERVPAAAKALYAYLTCFADEEGVCFPGNAKLSKALGKSKQSIEKYLRILCENGYLSKEREKSGNIYGKRIIYITPPEIWRKSNHHDSQDEKVCSRGSWDEKVFLRSPKGEKVYSRSPQDEKVYLRREATGKTESNMHKMLTNEEVFAQMDKLGKTERLKKWENSGGDFS